MQQKQPSSNVHIEKEKQNEFPNHQSPNTTLKKTLNIAPIIHPTTKILTHSNLSPAINSTSNKIQPLGQKSPAFNASESPATNFLVNALFSQQKQQKLKNSSPIFTSASPNDIIKILPKISQNGIIHSTSTLNTSPLRDDVKPSHLPPLEVCCD